ncbi:hypothetical protein IV102_32895 [bacterium]|nr:hypothetical protein [bacterium]
MLLAIFFMILLSLIGIALIGMVPVELKSATRTKLDVQAHYAATAGIRRARTWCQAVMTPDTQLTSPDNLGDASTWNNGYCNYLNEIVAVPTDNPDFTARSLSTLAGANLIPMASTRWGGDIYKALNIPASGPGSVDGDTVCLVSKLALPLGDWQVYTVIIPDVDSPGGEKTLDGAGQVVRQFGGAGEAGQRCYQIVCLAYYQGFPVVRAKSVFLESSFARYSLFVNSDPENTWYLTATAGQQATEGPVHTNGFFRFALDSGLWTDTSGKIPFRSDMTFATRPGSAVYTGMDYDGALYYRGNDLNAQNQDYRPFGSGDETTRYTKMIDGGRGKLRQTASPIALPQNNAKISNAAYGATNSQTFTTAMYTDAAISSHLDTKGVFVMGKSGAANQVAGGVVVKGNQQRMFLEAVGSRGIPYGPNSSSESNNLASGSVSTANPAVRVQAETAITKELWSTSGPFTTSSSTARTRTSITQTTINTSRSASRSLTSTNVLYGTSTLGTMSTYTTSGGGAGGVVQTTSTFVSTGVTSSPTATQSYYTTWSTPSVSTSTSWSPYTTQYSTYNTSTSVKTAEATWKPIDQVIETKNAPITLSPLFFVASQSKFYRPAGSQGSGADMTTFKVVKSGVTTTGYTGFTQFLIKEGTSTPTTLGLAATKTIDVDKVVVIKQSRTDPQTAVVFIMDRGSGTRTDGDPVLNGAVFTEGNVGGLAGVNLERKTIAGQIQEPAGINSSDPLGPQPATPSVTLNIRNNVWQYGTNPKAADPNDANKPGGADHGLGLVAEWINVNTRPGDFTTYSSGLLSSNNQILTLYATMLAGRKNSDGTSTGGFTVGVTGPQTSINGISNGTMGSLNTPMMRTVGGLIVANYFARLNLINHAGWNSSAIYDQQLALKPPPFFPNDGGLNPLTYIEERIWAAQNL